MTRSEFSVYRKIKILKKFFFFSDDADRDIPKTSTPVKARRRLACQFNQPSNEDDVEGDKDRRRGTKHDLTPGSKQNPNQPKSKRFLVGKLCTF